MVVVVVADVLNWLKDDDDTDVGFGAEMLLPVFTPPIVGIDAIVVVVELEVWGGLAATRLGRLRTFVGIKAMLVPAVPMDLEMDDGPVLAFLRATGGISIIPKGSGVFLASEVVVVIVVAVSEGLATGAAA